MSKRRFALSFLREAMRFGPRCRRGSQRPNVRRRATRTLASTIASSSSSRRLQAMLPSVDAGWALAQPLASLASAAKSALYSLVPDANCSYSFGFR